MQTAPAQERRRSSVFAVGVAAALANFLGWLLLTPTLADQMGDAIIYAIPGVSLAVGVLPALRTSSRRYGFAIIIGTFAAVVLAILGVAFAFMSGQMGE